MICSLHIKNYALINELEINLDKGFTIITGETGAGKSILLGALNLIAGQRADTSVLLHQNTKCIVEAEFDLTHLKLEPFFEEHDIDFYKKCIIRREINPGGKSRAFVNDTPVNLGLLKDLTRYLIDIHSQHQSLELNERNSQLAYLDIVAETETALKSYQDTYHNYKLLRRQCEDKKELEKQLKKDWDYYQFQWQEIDDLNLKVGEMELLKAEWEIITHAEEIKLNLAKANYQIQEQENSMIASLHESKNVLGTIARFGDIYQEIHQRLQSLLIEMKDIASEIDTLNDTIQFDSERLQYVNERMSEAEKLFRKHQVKTEEELLELKHDFENKINQTNSLAQEIEQLEQEIHKHETMLQQGAMQLRTKRTAVIPVFEKEINRILSLLGMPNAQFNVVLHETKSWSLFGLDEVQYMFSANKGVAPASLEKIASGGELSRIMLAVKWLTAQKRTLPSVVFDEIDTGVSGDVAAKMAAILKELSTHIQVICITHLPQIASKGKQHWFVYKDSSTQITTSHIKVLNQQERIQEIAKMLSHEKMSDAAIINAKELLGYKSK